MLSCAGLFSSGRCCCPAVPGVLLFRTPLGTLLALACSVLTPPQWFPHRVSFSRGKARSYPPSTCAPRSDPDAKITRTGNAQPSPFPLFDSQCQRHPRCRIRTCQPAATAWNCLWSYHVCVLLSRSAYHDNTTRRKNNVNDYSSTYSTYPAR